MTLINKKILSANKLLCFLSLMIVVGCTGTRINIPNAPEPNTTYDTTRGRPIVGEASGFQLLIFFPISVNDRQSRAYSQLVSQANGGFITDVKVKESWTYGFVGTVYRTTLTAMVYPYAPAGSLGPTSSNKVEDRLKKLDELKASKIITDEEYLQKRKALLDVI